MRRGGAGSSPRTSPPSSFSAASLQACDVSLPLSSPKESNCNPNDAEHRSWRKRRRMYYIRLQNRLRSCLTTSSSTANASSRANNSPLSSWSTRFLRRIRKIHPHAHELLLGLFVAVCILSAIRLRTPPNRRVNAITSSYKFQVLMPWSSRPTTTQRPPTSAIVRPDTLDASHILRAQRRNYGGLDIAMLEDPDVGRRIHRDRTLDQGKHDRIRPTDDVMNDNYYNLDDDNLRNTYRGWGDDQQLYRTKRCRRTKWHRNLPLNCNTFHEYDLPTVAHRGGLNHVGYVISHDKWRVCRVVAAAAVVVVPRHAYSSHCLLQLLAQCRGLQARLYCRDVDRVHRVQEFWCQSQI